MKTVRDSVFVRYIDRQQKEGNSILFVALSVTLYCDRLSLSAVPYMVEQPTTIYYVHVQKFHNAVPTFNY